jgi:lipopolysaccharide/colanic/teichoic acid biosynthesis glycosyltransferase
MGDSGLPRIIEVPVRSAANLRLSSAMLGLLLLSPVLLVAAVAIKATSRGPVLFKQRRVGRGGRHFTLLKLRTMREGGRGPRVTASGDARVTAVGRLLRHLKLDEIPELWNVVRGEMSFVGPRPEVPEYVDAESELWRRILRVRPGITDPITIRLRNEESVIAAGGGDPARFYREILQPFKLAGYASYLDQRTWRSDLRVLWQTVRAVLTPGSVSPPSADEMRACVERSGSDLS